QCPLLALSGHFNRAYRLGTVAILAMQVREQEHQRKRERPDNCSNPRPDFERASPTLSNSTGKVDRTDHQQ
ncbi:MAG: hypothetical protein WB769_03815, partial [Pseudolabrys sp.]